MLAELRDRIEGYLVRQQVCILSACGAAGVSAIPAMYRSRGTTVECLLPRWADVAYHLEGDPRAMVIVLDPEPGALCWVQIQGIARPIPLTDWVGLLPDGTPAAQAEDRYRLFQVLPKRIDLLDERQGWGTRETLDLGSTIVNVNLVDCGHGISDHRPTQ